MFVYQNNANTEVYINVAANGPTEAPDYILAISDNKLTVNGVVINPANTVEEVINEPIVEAEELPEQESTEE